MRTCQAARDDALAYVASAGESMARGWSRRCVIIGTRIRNPH
ncbi:hypothetical protein SA496_17090 [Pseudomonas sp. JS3066]|nr:hypothetical protein [Pseudomonas sp. JS3066]WVK91433.1 hypothetical protein SA496_17090 [Pseudomonas sp. JS3066]